MKSPFDRIRQGALVLVAVVIVALIGYRIAGFDWIGALWMTVITVSSVGYGEQSQLHPGVQLFTVVIIVFGMSATAYTLGGLVQLMLEGEFERMLGTRRVNREIENLENHVIICGFGRIGQLLTADLMHDRQKFVIIEREPELVAEARQRPYLCLQGDATEDEILKIAGIERARALVTALPSDAANVFITLTARNLNPEVLVIARAEQESTGNKLRQAGANKIVMPAAIGAHRMARLITRPSTADMMELVTETNLPGFELDEIPLPENAKLVGVSVRATEARRKHGLLVVAVKQAGGEMLFNPDADYKFRVQDTVILMGRSEDILRFRSEFSV